MSSSLSIFTLKGACEAMGGFFIGSPDIVLGDRILDSRKCKAGDLFIAMKGENTDGHLFIEKALDSGATAVLLESDFWADQGDVITKNYPDRGFLVVPSTLKGLQDWASSYRRRYLEDTIRIGVTGSSGKTTMKEMLGAILKSHGKAVMNPGNLNSDIGLPLTVLTIPVDAEYAVLEMGINRIGEMDELVEVFKPQMALVTHIGTAHVGLLGSRKGIALEKRKIFRYLTQAGGAIVWGGDEFTPVLTEGLKTEGLPVPVLTYGEDQDDFSGAKDLGFKGWLMHLGGTEVTLPLMGRHNLVNALGAVRAARLLGVSWEAVKAGLEEQKPLFGRGELVEGPVTMVVDCYNANPESFGRGIETLRSFNWSGRKILVAGAMGELGSETEAAHRQLGTLIAEESLDGAFFFGKDARLAKQEAVNADFPVFWTDKIEMLKKQVVDFARQGDLFYLKGSRSMELERLIEPLRSMHV